MIPDTGAWAVAAYTVVITLYGGYALLLQLRRRRIRRQRAAERGA